MASNFKLFLDKSKDALHIYKYGDLDSGSVYKMIDALKKHNKDYFEVFIDTSDLKEIHVFGIDVFQKE